LLLWAAVAAVAAYLALRWLAPGGPPTVGAPEAAPSPVQPEPGWEVARTTRDWQYIVIHHSASPKGDYRSIHRLHADSRKWEGCGYHFVIGNGSLSGDGAVEVGFRWTEQKPGAHAGSGPEPARFNRHGIGICLIGDFTRDPPTAAQMDSLARLTRFLMERYAVPPERVIGHGDIRNTECPGRCFSRRALLERIQGTGLAAVR
jgi:hypothetical protein